MATKFVLKQNDPRGRNANDSPPAEYVFDGEIFTLGSEPTNNLILRGSAAEQAVVVREGEQLTLMNSADGTRLNGETLRREAIYPLGDGDEIRVGNYTVTIVDGEENGKIEAALPTTATPAPKPAAIENRAAVKETKAPASEKKDAPLEKPLDRKKSSNNFAAVLDTLRTEEDSFYFIVKTVVKNKETETARIALEQAEIPIGADDENQIVFDIKKMTTVFGIARKDWSGIVIETSRRAAVFVNKEPLDADARRLRNDDRVSFAAPVEAVLVLHEPSLLVALEPLLSARTASTNGANNSAAATGIQTASAPRAAAKPKPPLFERAFFGYFSFVEILAMIIGTLIGAILFFLFFEFAFS